MVSGAMASAVGDYADDLKEKKKTAIFDADERSRQSSVWVEWNPTRARSEMIRVAATREKEKQKQKKEKMMREGP